VLKRERIGTRQTSRDLEFTTVIRLMHLVRTVVPRAKSRFQWLPSSIRQRGGHYQPSLQMHPEKNWVVALSVCFLTTCPFSLQLQRMSANRPLRCCQFGRVLFFALAANGNKVRSADVHAEHRELQKRVHLTDILQCSKWRLWPDGQKPSTSAWVLNGVPDIVKPHVKHMLQKRGFLEQP
jgi:hypothetical protein